jgi:uncharacterized protein (TIGR03083 family)
VCAVEVRRLARDERADLAAFLATLTAQQWQAPTLCTRWRVRDVVAHVLSYDNLGIGALIAVGARARFRPGRINDLALARYDRHTPEQLLALLAGNKERLAAALDGHPAAVRRRVVGDEREAAEAGMHGSPTLLVDGADPFAAPGELPSLSCRLHRDASGRTGPVPLGRGAAAGAVDGRR